MSLLEKHLATLDAMCTGILLFEDLNLLYPAQWNKQSHKRCQLWLSVCTYTMCYHLLVYFDWPFLFSIEKLTISYYPNDTEKADIRIVRTVAQGVMISLNSLEYTFSLSLAELIALNVGVLTFNLKITHFYFNVWYLLT